MRPSLSLQHARLRHATDPANPVARSNGAARIPGTLFSESVQTLRTDSFRNVVPKIVPDIAQIIQLQRD